MAVFFAALYTLFLEIFRSFFTKAVKYLPLLTALFTASVLLLTVYLSAMNALLSGISQVIPSEVSQVWGWVMPANTIHLLSAIYAAKIIRYFYYKNFKALNKRFDFLSK